MNTSTSPTVPSGPLRIPHRGPDREARLAIHRLDQHKSSDAWLPAGIHPAVDTARDEHLRRRETAGIALAHLHGLHDRFRAEDEQRDAELRDTLRRQLPEPDDARTATDRRAGMIADAERVVWAALIVLGEHVESVIALVRDLEPELLAELRDELPKIAEKKAEAVTIMRAAEAAEAKIAGVGAWVQTTVNGKGQPAPQTAAGRVTGEVLHRSLTRPWFRERPASEAATAQRSRPRSQDREADQTGVVSEIVETVA